MATINEKENTKNKIHIFVNRRKFDQSQGVTQLMTGAQIAALVDVPADKAVVRRETGDQKEEIPLNTATAIREGDHFLVTRKTVEGGW